MLKNTEKSLDTADTKVKLDTFPNTTARPTGQGYGAARTGPSVEKMNAGGKVGMPARMRNR